MCANDQESENSLGHRAATSTFNRRCIVVLRSRSGSSKGEVLGNAFYGDTFPRWPKLVCASVKTEREQNESQWLLMKPGLRIACLVSTIAKRNRGIIDWEKWAFQANRKRSAPMNKAAIGLVGLFLVMLLSGCMTHSAPPLPADPKQPIRTVGLISILKEKPMRVHASAFSGYAIENAIDWPRNAKVRDAAVNMAQSELAGVIVDLSDKHQAIAEVLSNTTKDVEQAAAKRAAIDSLLQTHQLDALIVVRNSHYISGGTTCVGPGTWAVCNSERGSAGLSTVTGQFNIMSYEGIKDFYTEVYVAGVSESLDYYNPISKANYQQKFSIKSFDKPGDWRQMSKAEWQPVLDQIDTKSENHLGVVFAALKSVNGAP